MGEIDLGSFLTGIASLGGTVASGIANKKNRDQNQKQFEETQKQNEELINKQNAQEQLLTEMTNQANAQMQDKANATNIELQRMANEQNKAISDQTNAMNMQIQNSINAQNQAIADSTNKANLDIANQTNKANLDIARETNALNKSVADQNLAFQREQQAYEEALQEKIFEREDTSYARTINDMRNSGLSPLAMSGLNGSGAVVGRTPSNNGMVYQGATMQGATMQGATMQGATMQGATMQSATVGASKKEKAQMKLFQKAYREQAKSDMASKVFQGVAEMADTMLNMRNKSAMVKKAEAEAEIAENDMLGYWGIQKRNPYEKTDGDFATSLDGGKTWSYGLKDGYKKNGLDFGGSKAKYQEWRDRNNDRNLAEDRVLKREEFNFRKTQDELNRIMADRVQSFNEQMGIVGAVTGGLKLLTPLF